MSEYYDEPHFEEPPDDWAPCRKCHGSGYQWVTYEWSPPEEQECHACNGRGGRIVDLDDYMYPDQDYDGPWNY
jgi:hypothetical protein